MESDRTDELCSLDIDRIHELFDDDTLPANLRDERDALAVLEDLSEGSGVESLREALGGRSPEL